MLKSMRRFTSNSMSIALSLAIALSPLNSALAQVVDTEAPVLIHRQLDSGVAGELQTFLARVSDDFGIETVTLYYRQKAFGDFNILPMRPLVDSIGEYMIAIETSVGAYPSLQYYIEAEDSAGNTANRGFSYAPIVLPLSASSATASNTTPGPIGDTQVPRTPPLTSEDSSFAINPTAILIGVGALLALGALASACGGDDPETPTVNPPINPPSDTVILTIVSDIPSVE